MNYTFPNTDPQHFGRYKLEKWPIWLFYAAIAITIISPLLDTFFGFGGPLFLIGFIAILALITKPTGSEFGCFIRNHTPNAVRLTIPFGIVENAPTMSAEEHKSLRQQNRERYGTSSSTNVNLENSLSQTHEAPAKKASNEAPPPPPTTISAPPPPASHTATDPHAGIDD